jgi:hypothetical protein
LRQEEFDFFVSKLAELLAEDIMDAHMVGISPKIGISALYIFRGGESHLRQVGYRKERVLVKDIALDEPLQEGP